MARFNPLIALVSIVVGVHAFPLEKRIAQTIADSTTKWEAACDAAGGGEQCNTIAVNAFGNLLAAADACGQQDAADTMIDLAKQLNSDAAMISAAQIFAQQPRNTPTSQAVPYCQSAPKNAELDGLFQCQFESADETTFVGGLSVGSNGTIPFGMTSPVSPAGSCPAYTSGPVPDGEQLSDLVSSPGTNSTSSGSASASVVGSTTVAATSAVDTSAVATATATSAADTSAAVTATATSAADVASSVDSGATATSSASAAASSSSSFLLSNGQTAQQQNAQFATLTANSSCSEGTNACVNGEFAQCVSGAYTLQSCGSGLSCFSLPLVNSAGTSITCTTESDAASRISNTGATGGVTGDNSTSASSTDASATGASATAASTDDASATASATAITVAAIATGVSATSSSAAASASSSSTSGFLLSNGQDAQQQNAQFASLTANSSCSEGTDACVNGEFAQCVSGAYMLQSCGSGLSCFALPLVNSAGTSVTCTTESDAASRIENTGATGGVTGSSS
ncbi:hypothetical protein DAEQUDRAFT_732430 [Daedalea quercina L-15889]|uniref:Carbohydrate-binding module family 19 domain-containing protein n=1 Tax=Daedalea quercina L-15889 TaxID=1314783 RepID=A0A165LLM2_9APHY|nr:hypothetical protein DAEQUDRAFT_732430 [Daedalea quercina L-15889]